MRSYGPNLTSAAQKFWGGILDRLPENLWVTWPKPRPFGGKLFERPLGFRKTKLSTKFEVPGSSSFEDIFDRIPKFLRVTWPKPYPFWEKLFRLPVGIPHAKLLAKFEVCSTYNFKDIWDRLPEILGPTWRWPRPRPLWELFERRARLSAIEAEYQIWSL